MVKTKQNESIHIEKKTSDGVFAMYSEYQRLKDLDDKQSKTVVNKVMDFLETAYIERVARYPQRGLIL